MSSGSNPTTPDKESAQLSALQKAYSIINQLESRLADVERERECVQPIAIVGMACRFPGGSVDPGSFWELLHSGRDAVREVPAQRWDVDAIYDSSASTPGKMYSRYGGFIDDMDAFDAAFFGISPHEATRMDPQHRLLLEAGWEALENAGFVPERLKGSRTGVFVGIGQNDYGQILWSGKDLTSVDAYDGTGNSFGFAPGRLSYVLGFHGPCLAVTTACSSSLVASHLACQSLRSKECDLALVGGVQLMLAPGAGVFLSQARAITGNRYYRVFDARSDGYLRGEGCGVVVLKRLADALADGDPMHAVILSSAINHDGRSSALTVPNGLAQRQVLRNALDNAGLKPSDIDYVETHGSGTPLGDPIEIEALADVYCQGRPASRPLLVGTVKANIGHPEEGAGVAGLIKTTLSLEHQEIPALVNFENPNPHIAWDRIAVRVPTEPVSWKRNQTPRRAGISSFGLSGTNVHIILEEAPQTPTSIESSEPDFERTCHLLLLSARDEPGLYRQAQRYAGWLRSCSQVNFADICWSANTRRTSFGHRLAIVASSVEEAAGKLTAFDADRERKQSDVIVGKTTQDRLKTAFFFAGETQDCLNRGRQLYMTQPTFRQSLDRCDEILQRMLDGSFLEALYPSGDTRSLKHSSMPPFMQQLALVSIEFALAELWQSFGVKPSLVLGYGVGEYVAACVAGVICLEDCLKLVARSANLEMNPDAFEDTARSISYNSPEVPFVSSLTGELIRDGVVLDARYWRSHLQESNGYQRSLHKAVEFGCSVILETGPDSSLTMSKERCVTDPDITLLWSLEKENEDWSTMLNAFGRIAVRTADIDWIAFDRDYRRFYVDSLPTYAFAKNRFWIEPRETTATTASGATPNTESDDLRDWLYQIEWQEAPRISACPSAEMTASPTWIVFVGCDPLGPSLCELIRKRGEKCFTVSCNSNGHDQTTDYVVEPLVTGSHDELLRDMGEEKLQNCRIVYLWALDAVDETPEYRSLKKSLPLTSGSWLAKLVRLSFTDNAAGRMWVVTRGAQSVTKTGEDLFHVDQSSLWGFWKSLVSIYPQQCGSIIDLEEKHDSTSKEADAALLMTEMLSDDPEKQVAVRGERRLVPRLNRLVQENDKKSLPQLRSDASYLITGGFGELGFRVALWMAKRGARHLVLTGKSANSNNTNCNTKSHDPRTRNKRKCVEILEGMGVKVATCNVNLDDEEKITALFERFDRDLPPLKGIVHMVGNLEKTPSNHSDDKDVLLVTDPRVAGSWLLHTLTQGLSLDFFAFFSPLSIVNGLKYVNSASTNSFVDGLSYYRKRLGLPALSIDWGPWAEERMSEERMSTDLLSDENRVVGSTNSQLMNSAQALEAFGRLLTGSNNEVIVNNVDWKSYLTFVEPTPLASFYEEIRRQESFDAAGKNDAKCAFINRLSFLSKEEKKNYVVNKICKAVAETLGLEDILNIDVDTHFLDMGMDSIIYPEFCTRLSDEVGIAFFERHLNEYPNINDMSEFILRKNMKTTVGKSAVEALYIDTDRNKLFSFYRSGNHNTRTGSGFLFCNPLLHEYIYSHMSLSRLSEKLSDSGFDVLRFDYYGTGDSEGICHEVSIERCLQNISKAWTTMAGRFESHPNCILGARLGATLALTAAERLRNVKSAFLWEPVIHGREYDKELEDLQKNLKHEFGFQKKRQYRGKGENEIHGFPYTEDLRREIRNLDPFKIGESTLERVLIIESCRRKRTDRLMNILIERGVDVERLIIDCGVFWIPPHQSVSDRNMEQIVEKIKRTCL